VGLIGPNGAGKTTFVDAAGGFTASSGKVILCGEDISGLAPHRRARLGMTRTWQGADLFDDLTVRENLRVAVGGGGWRLILHEALTGRIGNREQIDAALAKVGLEDAAERNADELTQGQRKLVGVARALVGNPRIVCLDEPAAGLDTTESRHLGERLRSVVDSGVAMLLVDHDMGLVLSVCDHIVVLDFGDVIARGTPQEIRRDHAVMKAYLGRAASEVEADVATQNGGGR
jgi:branched-chain amino acid transport system ATP-binding protein